MDINTIIEVNNKEYLLTQKVNYNGHDYFLAVEVKDGGKLQQKFGIFKCLVQDGKEYVVTLTDANEEKTVYELLVKDFQQIADEDPNTIKIGQIMELYDREYALLDYIPLNGFMFMVLCSVEKPFDVVVLHREIDDKGEMHLSDVSDTDAGIKVIQLFSALHKNRPQDN